MAPTSPNNQRKRPRWRRTAMISAQLLLGLALGAVIAEIAFMQRDDGAFPHVNFYLPDPELGVRLEPGATMRFRPGQNPLSTIRVNSRGFRGPEWPAAADDEVIVVGDSQVFGLGVEDDATFSAGLAGRSGRPVLNAGVPTYGPQEYLATARELLAERRAKVVVVALNFVNDPFEIDRPNTERHAVWDGWAVRSETAPAEVFQFPGRQWLFSRSHAVYALRRWLHGRDPVKGPGGPGFDAPLDAGTPSEGGLDDLVDARHRAFAEAASVEYGAATALASSKARIDSIDRELADHRSTIDAMVKRHVLTRGRPGDIVADEKSESGRSVRLTAAILRQIGRERDKFVKAMLADTDFHSNAGAHEAVKSQETLLAERKRLREQIAAGVPEPTRPPSLFHDYLLAFKALCDQHGAELVVVALPIDVQVDAQEWKKYGVHDAPDMKDSLVLVDDLIADAQSLGLRTLDATAALRAAEPGAFLDQDIHMTAKGHAALANALAATLAAPLLPPLRRPAPGLPAGRSFVPTADEWAAAGEVTVTGSTAAGCKTQILREWLRIQCSRRAPNDRLDAIELREGGTPATMLMHTADDLSLVTPMTIGAPISARLFWKFSVKDLEIRWPAGPDGKPKFVGALVPVADAPPRQDPLLPAIADLCACQAQVAGRRYSTELGDLLDPYYFGTCGDLWGDPKLAAPCKLAHPNTDHPNHCADLIACVQNDPVRAPACPEGHVHAFASNACFAACDPAHPCAAGKCEDWQGGGVCV